MNSRWQSLPPPWGPSRWNAPVEQREGSFMEARTHNWPTWASRFARFFATPMTSAMVSPTRVVGAYSKHPREAMTAMAGGYDYVNELAARALVKHANDLPLNYDEAAALMQVHLPPVRTPRERCGAGMTPSWEVPFCPRDRVPAAIREREAQFFTTANDSVKQQIGHEIANIEAIRAASIARSGRGGYGR